MATTTSTEALALGIPLYGRGGVVRAWTVVDPDVYGWASKLRWNLHDGYVGRSVKRPGKRFQSQERLHRLILGLTEGDGLKADHVNHDTLDNRRANLRVCTHAENHQNRRSTGDRGTSSKYRGVSFRKQSRTRPWQAYGCLRGEQVHLGFFDSEQEAADAAAAWREKHMPFTTN